jgi:hypothetical protein
MLVMMHYDAVKNPTLGQLGVKDPNEKHKAKPAALVNEAQYYNFLQRNPYDNFDENDIKSVRSNENPVYIFY